MIDNIKIIEQYNDIYCDQIINIVNELSDKWFTKAVLEEEWRYDGVKQCCCYMLDDKVISFIVFTVEDDTVSIRLLGTEPSMISNGYGSLLIKGFIAYAKEKLYKQIRIFSVPPEYKSSYLPTMNFLIKHGFIIQDRHNDKWENGALELIRDIK